MTFGGAATVEYKKPCRPATFFFFFFFFVCRDRHRPSRIHPMLETLSPLRRTAKGIGYGLAGYLSHRDSVGMSPTTRNVTEKTKGTSSAARWV